jgi:pimeloyl-ACP methyl ester carboxylesterase
MAQNTKLSNPADYIKPIDMNGLQGRILHVPARKAGGREILLVYGHHALLERWWGLVENLNDFGSVTMPDLPGFGGMDSFRSLGIKPTIDAYADYLAAFVKLRYKRKRITIVAISFGFVVATRMLQKYPELVNRVDLVVSIVGFMHHDDFHFKPWQRMIYSRATKLFSFPPIAWGIRHLALNDFIIRNLYVRLPAGKRRFLEMDPEEFDVMMDFEVALWQENDVSTHWATTSEFLNLDNCKTSIDLPLWHVASKYDHYFDNYIVEQHMRVVYRDYKQAVMDSKAHTPSITADKEGMAIMVPPKLRRALQRRKS